MRLSLKRVLKKPVTAALTWLVLLAGCGRTSSESPAGAGKGLTKVVLQTDWYAQPEHGGFYEAQVKGYYRDAGLEVEIRQGSPSTIPAQVVATGRADFAIGRSDDVMIAVGRGIPLVMLGALMQRDPQGIMYHRESGVRGFKDLDGRNIMAIPGSAFIKIMELKFGIKVAITPADFGMSRFLADNQFIQQCFITNEPYYVRKHGADVATLLVSDCGFSPYRVWYARKDFVEKSPEVVSAFTQASIRGWRDYIGSDHQEANARIASLNPKMEADFMEFSVKTMQDYHLVTGDPAQGESVGALKTERLVEEINQLNSLGLIDHPITVEEVFNPKSLGGATTGVSQ